MITISHPQVGVGRKTKTLPHVPGKNLRSYFRDAGLVALRLRCSVLNSSTRERLTAAHEPKDGEHIILELSGR